MQFKLEVKSDMPRIVPEWWSIGAVEYGHCLAI